MPISDYYGQLRKKIGDNLLVIPAAAASWVAICGLMATKCCKYVIVRPTN